LISFVDAEYAMQIKSDFKRPSYQTQQTIRWTS